MQSLFGQFVSTLDEIKKEWMLKEAESRIDEGIKAKKIGNGTKWQNEEINNVDSKRRRLNEVMNAKGSKSTECYCSSNECKRIRSTKL